jgi:hypothetical protein
MRIFHVLDDNAAEYSVEGRLWWYNAIFYSQEKYSQHTTPLREGQTSYNNIPPEPSDGEGA